MPKPNDNIAEQLVKLYNDSIKNLQARLLKLDVTDIKDRRHYLSVLKQLEDEFKEFDNKAADWIRRHVFDSYQMGSAEGLRQLRELGITPTSILFSMPDRKSVV